MDPASRIPPRRGFVAWQLCDPEEVGEQLKNVSDSHRERKRLLQALLDRPVRYLPVTTKAHVRSILSLREDFPNFSPVIEVLADGLSLKARMRSALKLPTTLLAGPPGLGKTVFAKAVAKRLGFELVVRSLAEMTAAFVLLGGSPAWSSSRPGLLGMLVADLPDDRAPLLMLDELDKVRSDSNYPPDVALLGLLESHSAREFRDEHLDVKLDLGPMSYLFTANRLETVRPEILSRMRKTEIWMPSAEQMPSIIASVDKVIRNESPELAKVFAPLPHDLIASLTVMPPRDLKAFLEQGYARMARQHSDAAGKLTKLTLTAAALDLPRMPATSTRAEPAAPIIPLLLIPSNSRVH